MNVKHKNYHLGIHTLSVWCGGWRKNLRSPHYTERASEINLLNQEAAQQQPACSLESFLLPGEPRSGLIMQKPWASGHPALLPPSSTRD